MSFFLRAIALAVATALAQQAAAQSLTPPQCPAQQESCRVETPSVTAAGGGVFALGPKFFVDFRRTGGEIDVWDLRAGRRLHSVPVGDGAIEQWAFSSDGAWLKIAGRGRREIAIDLAIGAVSARPPDAAFPPLRSAGRGRAYDRTAVIEDGEIGAPVDLGAYARSLLPKAAPLEYNECCNWSSELRSLTLSDDGDYAVVTLDRGDGDRAPHFWSELIVFRTGDGAQVARFAISPDAGPFAHFASDGRLLLAGDLWGGVALFPLTENALPAADRREPNAIAPLWSVLAPPSAPGGPLAQAYERHAQAR